MAGRFPLWLHAATGQWCKKSRGRVYYFGVDKDAALRRYLAEWPAIKTGLPRAVPARAGAYTVGGVCNHFLTRKLAQRESGEISLSMWQSYHRAVALACDLLDGGVRVASLSPADFARAGTKLRTMYGPVSVAGYITRIRTIFKHAYDFELIDRPVRYGPGFAKPSRRELRLAKTSRLLTADQVRRLIDAASPPMRAMILLGINCGYGQSDCASLTREALSEPGWAIFPRPKTGLHRRCPIWTETTDAIRDYFKVRTKPTAKADAGIIFITRFGSRYLRHQLSQAGKASKTDSVALEYRKLTRRLKIPGGFYRLRHTHRTIADGAKDQAACDLIMGHADATMAGNYRGGIEDARLLAVTEHIKLWLGNQRTG